MNSYLKEMKCQSCGEAYSGKIMQTLCLNSNCRSSLFMSYEQKTSMQDEMFVANVYNMWRYRGFHPLLTAKIIFAMGKSFIPFTCIDDAKFEGNGYRKFWKLNTCNQIITETSMEGSLSRLNEKQHDIAFNSIRLELANNEMLFDESGSHDFPSNHGAMFWTNSKDENSLLASSRTIGYEIAVNYNWKLPSVIFYPGNEIKEIIEIWKAFEEMEFMGWISNERPRFVLVNSEGSDRDTTNSFNGLEYDLDLTKQINISYVKQKNTYNSMSELFKPRELQLSMEWDGLCSAYKQLYDLNGITATERVLLLSNAS